MRSNPSWRTFLILWGGISVSLLGTQMTSFVFTLWIWDLTGKATPIALLTFFYDYSSGNISYIRWCCCRSL